MRAVRNIRQRPHIYLPALCEVTDLSLEDWARLLLDPSEPPCSFVRTQDGIYVEESSVSVLIYKHLGPDVQHRWRVFWNRDDRTRRRLTGSEKKSVAAAQDYRCAKCDSKFTETYEVDHIEEHCLRGNNARTNLSALCPNCHRTKTIADQRYGDAYFAAAYFGAANSGAADLGPVAPTDNVFRQFFLDVHKM